jgi:hypothetical protein
MEDDKMPSDLELRTTQKKIFHHLLVARESREDLEKLIVQARTEVDEEDAAFVEKQIAELYKK